MNAGPRATLEAWFGRVWWQVPPPAVVWLLWPLSCFYRWLLAVNQWGRRQGGTLQALPVPVLVVGNLVVGGAGKTPTVVAIVKALQQRGHRPGVISRGHGRHVNSASPDVQEVLCSTPVQIAGDEPLLIRQRCGVPVWVGAHRAAVATALCRAHPEVDVLVSDDGLQHAALRRQAELIVFDERGAGNGLLLPAGPLRQPLPLQLPHQSRVLYTAGRQSTRLRGGLAQRSIDTAWPLAAWRANQPGQAQALAALRGRPLLAVAGMAAPAKFFSMLQAAGLDFQRLPLPDHHAYATLPWPSDTATVITTEKDAVKLDPERMGRTAVWVVPLNLALPDELIADIHHLLFPTAPP